MTSMLKNDPIDDVKLPLTTADNLTNIPHDIKKWRISQVLQRQRFWRRISKVLMFIVVIWLIFHYKTNHKYTSVMPELSLKYSIAYFQNQENSRLSDKIESSSIHASKDFDYDYGYQLAKGNKLRLAREFSWSDYIDIRTASNFLDVTPESSNWPFRTCTYHYSEPLSHPMLNMTEYQAAILSRLYLAKHNNKGMQAVFLAPRGGHSEVKWIGLETDDDYARRSLALNKPEVYRPTANPAEHIQLGMEEEMFEINILALMRRRRHSGLKDADANDPIATGKSWLSPAKGSRPYKYLCETYLFNDPRSIGQHYDWRFFDGLRPSDEYRSIMHHMVRAWARFLEQEQVISWIAHGSLLGWYWNGLPLPWDTDNDVQMPIMELDRFAMLYNQTLVFENPDEGTGRYFIDVSPFYLDRQVKANNRFNLIDARFIDIRSGLYIDITGLANIENKPIDGSARVNCKNNHFYLVDDLSPLRKTLFEGEPVFVPNNFERILRQEYKYYDSPFYKGFKFYDNLRRFVWSTECEDMTDEALMYDEDHNLTLYGACNNTELFEEYQATEKLTASHLQEMKIYYKSDNWRQGDDSVAPDFTRPKLDLKMLTPSKMKTVSELVSVIYRPFRDDPI